MKRISTAALALSLGLFASSPALAQAPTAAQEGRREAIKQRIDKNRDGQVGPAERKRAKVITKGLKDRLDRNDDGRVGKVERKVAKRRVEQAGKRRSEGRGKDCEGKDCGGKGQRGGRDQRGKRSEGQRKQAGQRGRKGRSA